MSSLVLPSLNPLLKAKIDPRLMKDTYKKVHIYLFDFDIVLGKGSFSKVYKGINLNTNEEVAVKVVQMSSITTPKLKQLLLQQIDILMKVKNQNLIKCFEVLSSAKNTYIVMELCTYDFGSICDFIQQQQQIEKNQRIEQQNNQILHTLVTQHQHDLPCNKSTQQNHKDTLPSNKNGQYINQDSLSKSINSISSTKSVEFEQSANEFEDKNHLNSQFLSTLKQQKFYPFIKQIFLGLQYLQNQSIVHRDLKLSNIFLTASKACKIGDFGFATIIPLNQIQIKDTCCIGSPLYMSPQSYIQNVYSLKSDIWSFGILIFEMIYGNPPHWNCPTHQILKSQIRKQINLAKFQKLEKISHDLKQVLQGCLQVDVRKRFTIKEIKETKLFKKLFYQPLESNVIVSSRKKQNIQESNVKVMGRLIITNQQIYPEQKDFEYTNFSTIEKVNQSSMGYFGSKNNRFIGAEQNQQPRKPQKSQTFKPNDGSAKFFQQQMPNNSLTDRAITQDAKTRSKRVTPSKIEIAFTEYEQNNNLKFKSTDLNGNIFREVNQMQGNKRNNIAQVKSKSPIEQKQFTYKNSEGMQKFLKQMGQIRMHSIQKKSNNAIRQNPITFTDLTNILVNPQHRGQSKQQKEQESPKFASTFSGPFFHSTKYNKEFKPTINEDQNFNQKAQYNGNKRFSANNFMATNCSMFEQNNSKSSKPSTSYSPRNNFSSFNYNTVSNMKTEDKQNRKEETLLTKNYSTGSFISSSKKYSTSKQPERYDYKKNILEKCTSSPKFQTYQHEDSRADSRDNENKVRYMTTSSFFNSNQAKSPRNKDTNIIKQFNIKQELSIKNYTSRKTQITSAGFEGSNNLMSQFSTKMKQPSQIQKKTYWKGNNSKNFALNIVEKTNDKVNVSNNEINNESNFQQFNALRNHSNIFNATSKQTQQKCQQQAFENQKRQTNRPNGAEFTKLQIQSFKLLNGQIIIKDACQLIHYSRLLHKLSFMTENNGNSILLLQYSIQILKNLFEKCQNFEVKYHYDASTSNSIQIRDAFKANQLYLNSLILINQKQCYAIKKDSSSAIKQNSPVCNKTIQLKNIIQSYLKKYIQRKQALVKLFQCNVLFQNLTNKVKQAKLSSNLLTNEKGSTKKRSSLTSERGFLNWIRLQKVIQEIENQISSKKQNGKTILSSTNKNQSHQELNSKVLLQAALLYVEIIQRCVNQHSFIRLKQLSISSMKNQSSKIGGWQQKLNHNNLEQMSRNKSTIEGLLEGLCNDLRNNQKPGNSHNQSDSGLLGRNYSMLIGTSTR